MIGRPCPSTGIVPTGTCPGNANEWFYDACAPAQSQGGSCAGKVRLSCGGSSHGGFIGCQGNLNCFCGPSSPSLTCDAAHPRGATYTAADGNVTCYPDTDPNNPSCGAAPASSTTTTTQITTLVNPTSTPTPAPAGQCTRIKVYKGTTAVQPTTLVPGDNVTLAVAGTNATKGRIRVNGAAFVESTTLNTNGEYTVPFTVPAGVPSFTIEAEVFTNGVWQ